MSGNNTNSPTVPYLSPILQPISAVGHDISDSHSLQPLDEADIDDFNLNAYISEVNTYNNQTTDDNGTPDSARRSTVSSTPLTLYTLTANNLLSRHCQEIRQASDTALHSIHTISKNKLREMMNYHNNQLFSFLQKSDKLQSVGTTNIADTIFRRYGRELITMKNGSGNPNQIRDLNIDTAITTPLHAIDSDIQTIGKSNVNEFMAQLKWIFQQLRKTNEEVVRLESILMKKMETLDKLNQRLALLQSLSPNEKLPEVIQSFNAYVEQCFYDCTIEDTYKELIDVYKKWNILRDIVMLQVAVSKTSQEPMCAVCLTEPIAYATIPCGHTFCGTCSRRQTSTCFVCRGIIRERTKLYFT
jgi:hypothetical protein